MREALWGWERQRQCPSPPLFFPGPQGLFPATSSFPPAVSPVSPVLMDRPWLGLQGSWCGTKAGTEVAKAPASARNRERLVSEGTVCFRGPLHHSGWCGSSGPPRGSYPLSAARPLLVWLLWLWPLPWGREHGPSAGPATPLQLAAPPPPRTATVHPEATTFCAQGSSGSIARHQQTAATAPSVGGPLASLSALSLRGPGSPSDPGDPRLCAHLFPGTSL